MKRLTAMAVLTLVTAAPHLAAAADTVDQRFRWLAGCWAGTKGTTSFQEQWTAASPELMLGMSFTTKPQKPTEFEFLRIEMQSGVPTYMAQPQGAPPTPFAVRAALAAARRRASSAAATAPASSSVPAWPRASAPAACCPSRTAAACRAARG